MSKKLVLDPNVIQKFKWGGTNLEWEEEAEQSKWEGKIILPWGEIKSRDGWDLKGRH